MAVTHRQIRRLSYYRHRFRKSIDGIYSPLKSQTNRRANRRSTHIPVAIDVPVKIESSDDDDDKSEPAPLNSYLIAPEFRRKSVDTIKEPLPAKPNSSRNNQITKKPEIIQYSALDRSAIDIMESNHETPQILPANHLSRANAVAHQKFSGFWQELAGAYSRIDTSLSVLSNSARNQLIHFKEYVRNLYKYFLLKRGLHFDVATGARPNSEAKLRASAWVTTPLIVIVIATGIWALGSEYIAGPASGRDKVSAQSQNNSDSKNGNGNSNKKTDDSKPAPQNTATKPANAPAASTGSTSANISRPIVVGNTNTLPSTPVIGGMGGGNVNGVTGSQLIPPTPIVVTPPVINPTPSPSPNPDNLINDILPQTPLLQTPEVQLPQVGSLL